MIIAAYAGTGKTTAAKLYPKTVVDFVCMPYKYQLEQNGDTDESCKANPGNVMRAEWPDNYVSAIKSATTESTILLVPTDMNVLRLLKLESIPYFLCYPERSAKDIYHDRFINRGNTEDFIDIFIGEWDRFLSALERDEYGRHIVLRSGQFLADVLNPITLADRIIQKEEVDVESDQDESADVTLNQ